MRIEKPKNSRRWSSRIIEMLIVMVAIGLTINFFTSDTADTSSSTTYIEPIVVIPDNDNIEADALFDEGMSLMDAGDFEGALALVNMAIELDDAPPSRYFWKQAWLLGQVRQHQAAVDAYLMLQETGENPAYALGGLCFNYGSMSNFVEATRYCEAAGDYDSHLQYSQDSMCYIHGFTGPYELAVEECTNWINYEAHPYAYNNRSHAYLMMEQYNDAIADATQAIILNTDRPEMPYTNRGLAMLALGQYEEGYNDLMVAYGADNTYPDIYLGLGMYNDKMGDEYLARENYCTYVNMAWVTPAESITQRINELGGCS